MVLGGDLELLLDQLRAEFSVGCKFLGVDELLGFFFGEVEFGEHVVEIGGGVLELIEERPQGLDFLRRNGVCVWHLSSPLLSC